MKIQERKIQKMSLAQIREKITPLIREYGIEYVGLFGSFARGEETPESDIDLLVRFGKPIGLFTYAHLTGLMKKKLGRKVDLVTERALKKRLKTSIMGDIKTIYEKK